MAGKTEDVLLEEMKEIGEIFPAIVYHKQEVPPTEGIFKAHRKQQSQKSDNSSLFNFCSI